MDLETVPHRPNISTVSHPIEGQDFLFDIPPCRAENGLQGSATLSLVSSTPTHPVPHY